MNHCYWAGDTNPRLIVGRHGDDCRDDECRGCQPCHEPTCRVCERRHAAGTCAECLAETRETLREIGRMCDALPEEVEHRGVDGEAMMLLGPSANPEARGHLEASVAIGRVPADYLENETDSNHPLFLLGCWHMMWTDALEHDNTADELPGIIDYLDQQLSYMAGYEHLGFEDFARDIRGCRAHLESVLHDGEQVDRGAPCLECRRPLVLVHGPRIVDDRWVCKNTRCDVEDYTTSQYHGWVKADAIKRAKVLTAEDMATRFRDPDLAEKDQIKASKIRVWGSRGIVGKRGTNGMGRTLYVVADVEARLQKDVAA